MNKDQNKSVILIVISLLLAFSLAFNFAFGAISAFYLLSEERVSLLETEKQRTHARRRYTGTRGRMMEELDLTGEQRELINARRQELRSRLREKRKEVEKTRTEFVELLKDPGADEKKLKAAAEKFHEKQNTIRRMIFKDMLELRNMLDQDQRHKFGDVLMHRLGTGEGKRDRDDARQHSR